ncbi:MAG: class I SAM-dependent methyltransferase [Candidatus Methanofastidiosia archaeon]|jgi:ubiquinone/menaquinone biosynthesis C-methylase UbiE
MKDKAILQKELSHIDKEFAHIIKNIPPQPEQPPVLTPYWLHIEIMERYKVLSHADITKGDTVLEVGCGPHAIGTIPLGYKVRHTGQVVAADIGRWNYFNDNIQATPFKDRITPVECDATRLPFNPQFDTACILHALRSFRSEDTIVNIIQEMFRVSPVIFIAHTLPIAKNKAQKAHINMYNLRQHIFKAVTGKKDDLPYFPLKKVEGFVQKAGGVVTTAFSIDIGLPHYLSYMPKEFIDRIKDESTKKHLLKKWEKAVTNLKTYGEEHPPVGIVQAKRA